MPPELSIILPVYNGEKFVSRAISSVLQSKLQQWELIIINDGSTDNTNKVCREFAAMDSRIIFFEQKNHGLSYSRNQGVSLSTGKYVAFLDADDYVEEDYYENMLKLARRSDADFIVSGFCREFIHASDHVKRVNVKLPSMLVDVQCDMQELSMNTWFYNVYIHVWNKLYQRSYLDKYVISFDDNLRYGEDVPYNIRNLEHASKLLFTDLTGYHYICHENVRLTTAWRPTILEDNCRIYHAIIQHEKRCWNLQQSVVASGMYLRSVFLAIEHADLARCPQNEISKWISDAYLCTLTDKAIENIFEGRFILEFYIYGMILSTHNVSLIHTSVRLRRLLKKMLGR